MAKKSPKFVGAAVPEVEVTAVETAAKASPIGVKGPRGVVGTAIVSLLTANPKRAGSAAWSRYEGYVDGLTVDQTLAAGLTTADLVYDAAHGNISIAGYDAKALPPKKERVAKAPKEVKAPKAKKAKAAAAGPTEAQTELAAITQEETID